MPKSHPPYPSELRRRMVDLVREGRSEIKSRQQASEEA